MEGRVLFYVCLPFIYLSLQFSNTQTHVIGVCGGATTAARASPAAPSDTSATAASAAAERRRSAQAEATGVVMGAGGRRGEGEEAAVVGQGTRAGKGVGFGGKKRATRAPARHDDKSGARAAAFTQPPDTASCLLQLNTATTRALRGLVGACWRAGRAKAAPRPKACGAHTARARRGRSRATPIVFGSSTHALKHSPITGIVNRRPRAVAGRQGGCSERMSW